MCWDERERERGERSLRLLTPCFQSKIQGYHSYSHFQPSLSEPFNRSSQSICTTCDLWLVVITPDNCHWELLFLSFKSHYRAMESQSQLSKVFVKKTRKGKVIKLVREKYLRDDIGCGYLFGNCLTKVNPLRSRNPLLFSQYFKCCPPIQVQAFTPVIS